MAGQWAQKESTSFIWLQGRAHGNVCSSKGHKARGINWPSQMLPSGNGRWTECSVWNMSTRIQIPEQHKNKLVTVRYDISILEFDVWGKTVFILKYQICWQCILQYCVFQPLLRLEENHVSLWTRKALIHGRRRIPVRTCSCSDYWHKLLACRQLQPTCTPFP